MVSFYLHSTIHIYSFSESRHHHFVNIITQDVGKPNSLLSFRRKQYCLNMILMIPFISSLASLGTSVVHWSKPNRPSYFEAHHQFYEHCILLRKTCCNPFPQNPTPSLKDKTFLETSFPRRTDFTWSAPGFIVEYPSCSLRGHQTPHHTR